MGRTDFAPLSVPEHMHQEAPPGTSERKVSLDELLNRPSRAMAAEHAHEPPNALSTGAAEAASVGRLQTVCCPHCGAGLSATEAKFGRCLGCGKAVNGGGALVVHI
jgi:hypothetical protein